MSNLLLVILVLALLGAFGAAPFWPHAQAWGWGPSSGLGTVLLIVVIVLLLR